MMMTISTANYFIVKEFRNLVSIWRLVASSFNERQARLFRQPFGCLHCDISMHTAVDCMQWESEKNGPESVVGFAHRRSYLTT